MRRRKGRLYRLSFRLALFAVAIQAAIPFLLAAEIRAYAAATESGAFTQELCLHDGASHPSDSSPCPGCNISCFLLCTTLAASMPFGLAGQAATRPPLVSAGAAPAPGEDRGSALPLFAHPYRSRAPPLV
jgi:hypothetical protein